MKLSRKISRSLCFVLIIGFVALTLGTLVFTSHRRSAAIEEQKKYLVSLLKPETHSITLNVKDRNLSALKTRLEYFLSYPQKKNVQVVIFDELGVSLYETDLSTVRQSRHWMQKEGISQDSETSSMILVDRKRKTIGVIKDLIYFGEYVGRIFELAPMPSYSEVFFQKDVLIIYSVLLSVFVIIMVVLPHSLNKEVSLPLKKLAHKLAGKNLLSLTEGLTDLNFSIDELNSVKSAIIKYQSDLKSTLQRLALSEADLAKERTTVMISQQVAHDIRSPLAALTAVTQGLSELSEDKRIMVRSAVQRINDIANDLAERGSQSKVGQSAGVESDEVNVEFLTSVIDTLVSEKRLQHRSHLGISIQSALSAKSYGLFAKIQLAQFKRVLSNLVNNAVEALGENGSITVDMKTNANDDICISIADTGKGIAPENLAKIFERGVSVDKKEGQGLGLFHARESVESWGGKIEITSCQTPHNSPGPNGPPSLTLREGECSGTMVTITLPRQNEPDWFVPELFIYEKMTVIILDDDQSIHQIWQGRFETLKTQIELHHFSNGDALRQWYSRRRDGLPRPSEKEVHESGPMLILCDYEILGSSESGLDVIEELQLQDHTVLVTSRFEEKNVRERCKNLGIRLLPKNLAGFVPIKLKEISQDLQYVLIDDSRMNRTTWEIMAKRHQKKIVTFERPKDFYDVAEKINKDVQLYVDLNLGHGQNGKDVTKKISEKGFEKVYLYTGETSVDASQMPWLSGVVGKGVPFVG